MSSPSKATIHPPLDFSVPGTTRARRECSGVPVQPSPKWAWQVLDEITASVDAVSAIGSAASSGNRLAMGPEELWVVVVRLVSSRQPAEAAYVVSVRSRQVLQWGVLPVDEHPVAHHYGGPVVEDDLVVPQRTPACTQSNIRMPYRVLGDSSRANAGVLDRRVRRQREGEVHCWYWHSCEGLLVSYRLAVAMMANMSRQPSCPCSSH